MFKLALLTLLVAVALATNTYFDGMSDAARRRMMGTRMDKKHASRDHLFIDYEADNIPASFDASKHWPECSSTINYIRDQAQCGSCWAVAAASTISDRVCIHCMKGQCGNSEAPKLNEPAPCVAISEEQIMACCRYCGDGCDGGYPIDAMRYWSYTGVVTGAWYGSGCGCQPYEVKPKAHERPTPACQKRCEKGYPVSFNDDKHYGKSHAQIANSVRAIQTEIMTNGPVECAFNVYLNFMKYPTGPGIVNQVYVNNAGSDLDGGHAIKVVGWGTDAVAGDYWLIHNSWNTTWGLSGMFKYKRGGDLYGMEDGCVSGIPACKNIKDNKLFCTNNNN